MALQPTPDGALLCRIMFGSAGLLLIFIAIIVFRCLR